MRSLIHLLECRALHADLWCVGCPTDQGARMTLLLPLPREEGFVGSDRVDLTSGL